VDERPIEPRAVDAARRVGARDGFVSERPVLIQETNNSVVWLHPHEVIAKVGKWAHSEASLVREHAVAGALASAGAPVVSPIAGIDPARDRPTGFVVTLWERIDVSSRAAGPDRIAGSLRELHAALNDYDGELPNFEAGLDLAEATLWDDHAMRALSTDDRSSLREAFERLRTQLSARGYVERRIHGEAHDGNLLMSRRGLRWIDLEAASVGPLEWDLAFLPDAVSDLFPEADAQLLAMLRVLNSARVATWCFARAEFADMRRHGNYHLRRVKKA
jgi:Phosphotransferase enzyme family